MSWVKRWLTMLGCQGWPVGVVKNSPVSGQAEPQALPHRFLRSWWSRKAWVVILSRGMVRCPASVFRLVVIGV
jgi:hypothetical protein